MKSPCRGCEDRTISPNCHTNCIAYRAFLAEKKKINEKRMEFTILFHENEQEKRKEKGRRKLKGER